MKWVVDTCVIIDVLRGDDEFSELSADAIDAKMKDGLWIAPITYVELAPSFNGDVAEQDELLADFGISVELVMQLTQPDTRCRICLHERQGVSRYVR